MLLEELYIKAANFEFLSAEEGVLPVSEFLAEAIEAIRNDILEAPIAWAKNSREKREALFDVMNK